MKTFVSKICGKPSGKPLPSTLEGSGSNRKIEEVMAVVKLDGASTDSSKVGLPLPGCTVAHIHPGCLCGKVGVAQ